MALIPPLHSVSLCFAQTGKAVRRILQRALLYSFVALTLVCAQQEAMLHALAHVQEQLASHQDKDKNPSETTHCLKCDAFAPMAGALPSVLPDLPLVEHGVALSSPFPGNFYTLRDEIPFSARAPPLSL